MAKGARASTIKSNNAKLKANVFGPVETERTARLSAKLLELASAPKPLIEEAEAEKKDSADMEDTPIEVKPAESMCSQIFE